MRKLFSSPGLQFMVPFLLAIMMVTSCKNKNEVKKTDNASQSNKDPNARMTDFLGAMEYEFNMLKNPTTGKIPLGIRDIELQQAHEIFARQQQAGRIEAINAYSFQGPNNLGGRTRALVYDIRHGTSNAVIMAGGVSGGVYKSIDGGATWVRKSPIGDLFSVTTIAQDTRPGESSPGVFFRDTWYYAGGEALGNSAGMGPGLSGFYLGKGVYKSTDNGETWTHLPLSNTGGLEGFDDRADLITKLVVHPVTGHVYMAALDAIYRSTDFGSTWSSVLTSTSPGWGSDMLTDITITPMGTCYAAFSGFCNSTPVDMPGVWISPSGSPFSWTKIAGSTAGTSPAGWNATGSYGRVVLAHAPSMPSIVYALYWNGTSYSCTTPPGGSPLPEAELFFWDDPASTWTAITTLPDQDGTDCSTGNDPFACQTGYDLVIAVKPDDPATIFIGGTNLYRSTNTGATWTRIGGYAFPTSYFLYPGSHPDMHAITFLPISSSTMLCGNDGGIQLTTDNLAATVAWTPLNTGYRTYQYYYVDIDPRVANDKVIGGAQDNGTTRNIGGTGTLFESVFGGDGVSVGLTDPAATGGIQYEYIGFQNGNIYRRPSTDPSGSGTAITPTGEGSSGLFITLFKLDPDNTERLYYANDNTLRRTTSASTVTPAGWTSMTGVATAVTPSIDITALALSRGTYSASTSSLFFGTSDGRVYRLDDPTGVAAATSPVNITAGSFPPSAYVSSIAVNPRNDDTVLVTFSNYGVVGNVWWTGNANSPTPTWTNVEGALTAPSFRSSTIHAVLNSTEVQYYIGTSVGMFRSGTGFPGTPGWTQEGAATLGNAVVSSMALRPSDGNLLVGTHGYGMWKTSLSLTALPVQLTEFKGTLQNNKTALLQWTTSAEYNSKHFELERSFDGTSYTKIATIAAAGNSSSARQYSYSDRGPLTEKNHYRLRSVDMDDHSKFSSIVLLKLVGVNQDMQVLGNPFKNNTLVIRFVRSPEGKGELRLNDMSGRLVARRTIGPGEQLISFTIPAATAGTYILQAVINGKTYSAKVLKE